MGDANEVEEPRVNREMRPDILLPLDFLGLFPPGDVGRGRGKLVNADVLLSPSIRLGGKSPGPIND
jgi:hypothetical protein